MLFVSSSLRRRFLFVPSLVLLAAGLCLVPARTGHADDIDLLRFQSTKPYVFIMLDTSTSMCLSIENEWLEANCDDPRSKLYQAKQVLYETFSGVDGVHFGFASYNQDQLRVRSKHWLYFVEDSESNRAALATLPIDYPNVEPGNVIDVAVPVLDEAGEPTGNVDIDVQIDGDLLTFGRSVADPAGACDAPLDLAGDRDAINRYPKLGLASSETTQIWVAGGSGNRTYRLTFRNPTAADKLGRDPLRVRLDVERLRKSRNACDDPANPDFDSTTSVDLDMRRYRQFLMWDDTDSQIHLVAGQTQNKNLEQTGGFWNLRDVEGFYSCGDDKPFSGVGWEGNYDTGDPLPSEPDLDIPRALANGKVDTWCPNPLDLSTCRNLHSSTTRDPTGGDHRELDLGDMLPFNWVSDNQSALLERLNPLHSVGLADYGTASYFLDTPSGLTGALEPRDPDLAVPLVGGGTSPLSDVTVDFRCWYSGSNDNKCKNDASPYPDGFEALARAQDLEWECRRPYLILITDGENNCSGESIKADTANFFRSTRTQTWVVNLGTENVTSIVSNGKGEEVTVETKSQLRDELREILGIIEEETRSFASAAVPSVQADVADKIFLTQFTPLNGESVWPGEVHAFLKPLPVDPVSGAPDEDHPNHQWEAGERLLTQAPNAVDVTLPATPESLKLGTDADQRRVYYSVNLGSSDRVPRPRRLLSPLTVHNEAANDIREDLWKGLGVVPAGFELGATNPLDPMTPEATAAHQVLKFTYVKKTATLEDENGVPYSFPFVMGDIFHSNPQVIGGPANTLYFQRDLFGYRDFVELHAKRRKVLLLGANDGMLHAFDAGQFRVVEEPTRLVAAFDNGSGKEIFAYVPRSALPTLRGLATQSEHRWGVDGTPTVADVHIDPAHAGTPNPDEREWRTVVIGGMRRGGNTVYALDVTQPEPITDEITHSNSAIQDSVEFVPVPNGELAEETHPQAECQNGPTGTVYDTPCHPEVRYPHPLWEFTDTSDEDADGRPDLAQTWSTPNLGALRVVAGQDADGEDIVETRFVAVFGGGFDSSGTGGNWLYMVDIETGKTLYKRRLDGSVPAEPAAVDIDQDGYLDRVYAGTVGGRLWRVDLDPPASLLGGRIDPNEWEPYVLFDTANLDADGNLVDGTRKPIYFRPSVLFVRNLGRYALAFGTGNREDQWTQAPAGGNRFYVFVDDSDLLADEDLPYTLDNLTLLGEENVDFQTNYLEEGAAGYRGWYLQLDEVENELMVTPPTSIAGILVFSTFLPDVDAEDDPDLSGLKRCEKRGDSRNYTLFTINGNGILPDIVTGEKSRYRSVIGSFVSEPFIEQYQTSNESDVDEPVPPELRDVTEALQDLFPRRCRFVESFRFDIKTLRSDTGVEYIASIPVCILESNWKEYPN